MSTQQSSIDIWADLDKVTLRSGKGSGKPGDCCVIQEIRRRCDLGSESDACPPTMCPVVHALMITANDSYLTPPSRLLLLAPKAINTLGDVNCTVRRAMRLATEAMRGLAIIYDAKGDEVEAEKLRNWPEIKDAESAESAAEYAAKYAKSAEYAAKSAAKSAEYAAEYAAKYAAKSAAEYAAKYAAEYAAEYAEYAAKYAAKSAAEYAKSAAEYAAKSAAKSAAEYAAKSAEYAEIGKKARGEFCLRMIEEFCTEEITG